MDQNKQPLIELLERYERNFEELDGLLVSNKNLRLTYEDYIARDPVAAYAMSLEFLDLDRCEVKVNYNKTNTYPLRDTLINFNEAENELSGIKFFEWSTSREDD